MNQLQKLINTIKSEDHTKYLEIIEYINVNKLETYDIGKYLYSLNDNDTKQLTTTQLQLLKSMPFKGGYRVSIHYSNPVTKPLIINNLNYITTLYSLYSDIDTLSKEDLPFLSTYMRTKWKQANPNESKTKKQRGTGFTFNIDAFSLSVFRQSITKRFLRTEAKNLIMAVNASYINSSKDMQAIKIRNKYYYTILENTDYLTKAAMNSLIATNISYRSNEGNVTLYQPDEDEVIAFNMNNAKEFMSFTPIDCMDSYSTDTQIITSNKGYELDRENRRVIGATSALMTAYVKTNNKAYLTLANRMVKYLPEKFKEETLKTTQSIVELRNTLQRSGNDSLD